jgi:predicted P-loop ATPase
MSPNELEIAAGKWIVKESELKGMGRGDAAALKSGLPKSVSAYLDALVWDGTPRIDRWLVDHAGAEDSPHVCSVFRVMLIAAIRRVRVPGCVFDQLPIIVGPHGSGKSSALRVLAVEDDWFTDSVYFGPDTARFMEAAANKWIIEAPNMEGMSRAAAEMIKALLAKTHDVGRVLYAPKSSRVARQFVLIGTTNVTEGYLRDATGNRRFCPVPVRRFDLDRLRADRDQLWAEASVAEALGESIRSEGSLDKL